MDKIAKAFIKAKKEFAPAMKTSTNPHFKSKYTDLAACVEAVDDAFLNNAIVMYQETFEDATGVTVETVLLHESGEQIRCGKLHVPASKNDPQGFGSALTYARRYSLMAACGIAPEDDDGNAAVRAQPAAKPSLPRLTDEEAEAAHNAWDRTKEAIHAAADDGVADAEVIANAWGKLPSNVRSAIKRHGERIAPIAQNDSNAKQHIASIN